MEPVLREKDFETLSIRFSGFGGQGIVLAGVIYGEAAVADGLNAVQTQSYGSASRGGASKCDLIISKEKIYELESSQIDVLISMSQDAYETYIKQLKRGGVLIIDKDLVRAKAEKVQVHEISATDIAFKEFGQKIMGNMVIVGYLAALLGIVSKESLRKSIRRHLPEKLVEDNFRALEEGHNLGLERSKRREN
ncbi:MAG: 2-oxoacid:acceptor oxidoreductase family protein [Candidatus Zixiibacteriota bacterium]